MVHGFGVGQIDKWQNLFNRNFRRWLELAKSYEPLNLYRSRRSFSPNFNRLREYTKRIWIIRMQLLKRSLDPHIRQLYIYLVNRDKTLRGVSSLLRRYTPPMKRNSQPPPTLELERTLRQVMFLKIKENSQTSKKGAQVQGFRPGLRGYNSLIAQKKMVSQSLKLDAEMNRMQYLFIGNYDIQTKWLKIQNNVLSDDISRRRILFGYSSTILKFIINLRANTVDVGEM